LSQIFHTGLKLVEALHIHSTLSFSALLSTVFSFKFKHKISAIVGTYKLASYLLRRLSKEELASLQTLAYSYVLFQSILMS